MTASTDRVLANARLHLPGALDTVLQYELFNVLNDFYQQSNIWQEDITFAVTALASTSTKYTITPVETASIVRLLWILNPSMQPVYGEMATPGTITLDVPPPQNDTYTATVSLTVNDPVTSGLPAFLDWPINKYSTGIVDGLVGRMMAQPAKPYSNTAMAAIRLRSFRSTISTAKTEALHRNINNGQVWRFPRSFATRRR